MTDRLGEALAKYDDHVAKRGYATAEDMAELAAAARAWHTLTNPTDDTLAKSIAAAVNRIVVENDWNDDEALGLTEAVVEVLDALIMVDALTVTAEPEILPPNPGRVDGPQTEN